MRNPKIILGFLLNKNKIQIYYDKTGTELVDEYGKYLLGDYNERNIIALNSLMVNNNISTLVHTGTYGNINYPPFRKEWFE